MKLSMNLMKSNRKFKNVASICFVIVSLALFLFLFVINYKSGKSELLFNEAGNLNVTYTAIIVVHAIFTIVVPVFLGRKMFKYLRDQLPYVSFLAINLMINCLTYYFVLIKLMKVYTQKI